VPVTRLRSVAGRVVRWVWFTFLRATSHTTIQRKFRASFLYPYIFPYTRWLSYKVQGGALVNQVQKGLLSEVSIPPDTIRNLQEVTIWQLKCLRTAYKKVDHLPTVERGKQALGVNSVFELDHYYSIESPYSSKLQRPEFFIPGVRARTFYNAQEFPWTSRLEKAFPTIQQELLSLIGGSNRSQDVDFKDIGFTCYVTENGETISDWKIFNFFFHGEKHEKNCALCPKTVAILESLPGFEKDHIMFSVLNAKSKIPPHYGPMNGIIRVHLPLIVPSKDVKVCGMKVGKDQQAWTQGKVMAFDDSFLHSAWNYCNGVRIVLFLNFWNPCFSADEISVLEEFRKAYELLPGPRRHAQHYLEAIKND